MAATRIEIVTGNIVEQPDIDAVVNAANALLRRGGGVAGAIHRAAGPALEQACAPLAPLKPGEAVITDAFNLPNRFVIHCLGPVYGRDHPGAHRLADCHRNALRLAEEHGLQSLAFPALSTGAFGYPLDEAADVVAGVLAEQLPQLRNVALIRFVLSDARAKHIFQSTFRDLGIL